MFDKFSQVKYSEKLAKHCWFGIGGAADYYIEIDTLELLQEVISEARKLNIPCFILGGGSNLLFHDDGFRGIVIKPKIGGIKLNKNGLVEVGAGVNMIDLVKEVMNHDLSGIEVLFGLPGTVGGAIFGNAGAKGVEIGDYIKEVTLLGLDGELYTKNRDYFEFGYRSSILHKTGEIIISATLKLKKDKHLDKNKAIEAINFRKEKQPNGKNNGSFFKNPEGDYAGRLIDQAGLKGYKIGGIYISEKHGNFFMNDGSGTFADVVALKEYVKKEVYSKFSVVLEEEVLLVLPNGKLVKGE